jgi:hypothetical protein
METSADYIFDKACDVDLLFTVSEEISQKAGNARPEAK